MGKERWITVCASEAGSKRSGEARKFLRTGEEVFKKFRERENNCDWRLKCRSRRFG